MDYTIVTFGDFGLMVMALNGIAAITNHSSFAFIPFIGVMTGMFFLVSRYLTTMRLDLHHLLTGFILFNVMFVPKVDVLVESTSGQVQPVANVPVGLATPLSITTLMGRYFAEQFETVFSVASNASLLENGYMDALSALIKVRDFDIRATDANSSTSSGMKQDIHRTIMNYLTECALYDLNSSDPSITWSQIRQYSGENIWEALKTEYVNIDATSYLYSSTSPVQRNCALLWEDLNAEVFTNPAKTEEIGKGIMKMLGKANIASMTYDERMTTALDAIRINSGQAQRYMYNSLMVSWLNEADSLYSMKASDMGSTIMKTQAAAQNNVRWAAEQSQFERYAKPIISFIELFVIAATPIMAFVIVAFGTTGLALAFKYLMMLVWVSFWAPTLALANFFIHYKVVDFIEYLVSQKTPVAMNDAVLNIGELPLFWSQVQDWIGVGGMMAAATPALTLMLLYGTSQTAVNLASKLNQGERVDEKIMAPDLVKQNALNTLTSNAVGNTESGIVRSGGQVFDTNFNFGQSASTSLKTSQSALQSMNSTMQTQYGLNNTNSAQTSLGESFSNSINNSKDTTLTSQYQNLITDLQRIGQSKGLSADESKVAAKQAAANFGAGLPLSPITFGAQLSKGHTDQEAARLSQQYNTEVASALQNSELFSKANRTSTAFQDGFNQTNQASISAAQQESKNQSEMYAKIQSHSKLVSATDSLDSNKALSNIGTFSQLAQKFEEAQGLHGINYSSDIVQRAESAAANDSDFAKRYGNNLKDFGRNIANTPQRTQTLAALKTLAMSKNPEDQAFFYQNVGSLLNIPQNDTSSQFRAEASSQGMDLSKEDQIASKVPADASVSQKTGELPFNYKTPSKQQLASAPTQTGKDKQKIKQAETFSGQKMMNDGVHSQPGTNSPSSSSTPSQGIVEYPQQAQTHPQAIKESGGNVNRPSRTAKPKTPVHSAASTNESQQPIDAGSVTIGKPNKEFVDGTANILPAAGSAVPLAEKRSAENPIYLDGVAPKLQSSPFAGRMRERMQDVNKSAIREGNSGRGRELPGYNVNQTPSERLMQDGVEQDKKFHDAAEDFMPGAGGFLYDNASMAMGGAGAVRGIGKMTFKAIKSQIPKEATAAVRNQAMKKAYVRQAQVLATGAAGGVVLEGPARQAAKDYAMPDPQPKQPTQYITPPPK